MDAGDKKVVLPPLGRGTGLKEEETKDHKFVEFTTTLPADTQPTTRLVRRVAAPDPPPNKVATTPRSPVTILGKIFTREYFPIFWPPIPQPQSRPVVLELTENKSRPIPDLRVQIGSDEDNSKIVVLRLLHRKRDSEFTDIDLYVDVADPEGGDNVAGRLEQVTIHLQFLDPDSGCSIPMEEYSRMDAVQDPTVCSKTESQGTTSKISAQVSTVLALSGEASTERNTTAAVNNEPIVKQLPLYDTDDQIRWTLQVNNSLSTARLGPTHGFHHRICKHLPVRARIRVSCICRKVAYIKPEGDGQERLEMLLKEESAGGKLNGPA